MSKFSTAQAAISKAMSHLDGGERAVVTDLFKDCGRIFDLVEKMMRTPDTEEGLAECRALRGQAETIQRKWYQD